MKKNQGEQVAHAASCSYEEVLRQFHSVAGGLTTEQAEENRDQFGKNQIVGPSHEHWLKLLGESFITPFTLVLIALAVVSVFVDGIFAQPQDRSFVTVWLISIMVFASGLVSFVQTIRANQAADQLKKMIHVTAAVSRDGRYQEIPTEDIVCGDFVKLAAGDMIPADMRLLQTKDLFLSQAALTGESYPVEKDATSATESNIAMTERSNLVLMGSNVLSGTAEGIVIATGEDTVFGSIAHTLNEKPKQTSFELGIKKTSLLLIRFMVIMAPIVIVINGLTKGNWLEAILFGLSVAVGLTPEMLPMIVTTNLVRGARVMAKKGTIIKNLSAIQNFGAMDLLCTDKTGTLTQDKIVLEYHLDCNGNESNRVLRHAYMNSYYQTGLKNIMDIAIIQAADTQLTLHPENYRKVDEVPFDFDRRRMSVVIADQSGKTQMITKGAIEEILSVSSFVDFDGQVTTLTPTLAGHIMQEVEKLNQQGFRVLGVAQKTNPPEVGAFSTGDETEMVLIGYLAFLDPPKETAKAAISTLHAHGVDVRVLTGDNALVTQSVCQQVGIATENMVEGSQLEKLTEEEWDKIIETTKIFVKLTPQQKADLVQRFQKKNHTIGFLGDGINDAPALKVADVGISVDTAVDIAKESANVILLEKDLMVLERGILAGREVFGNIMKYVKATLSSNFGNILSVLVASIFLPFLPMLPLQLLFLNFMYDLSCLAMPWDRVDQEYLASPKKWTTQDMGRFMVWFGPTSSIFDLVTFYLLYTWLCPLVAGGSYFQLSATQQVVFIAVFHAGWFVESFWTQSLVIHALRSPKLPFIQSRATWPVIVATSLGVFCGSILPMTSLGSSLGLMHLPTIFWSCLLGIVCAYLCLVTLIKNMYLKRYHQLY